MNQHKQALQELETELGKHYENKTAYTAEFGDFSNVVGMAFDRWSKLSTIAALSDWNSEGANDNANDAWEDYQLIKETVQLVRNVR